MCVSFFNADKMIPFLFVSIFSLIRSISDGNAKRLTKLLRHGAGLKLTPNDLSTSLFIAIKQSREECVASLLNAGTDANSSDADGKPAIYLVMEYGRGNPVILKSLLRSGANPDKVTYNTQQTAMHAAAKKGYQVCIKTLLLAGGKADKSDGYGNTALMYAAREGHITIVRTMLQEKADPNARNNHGETALHLAVKGNHTLCIEELLCQGASTDICDNKGQNVLLLALKTENYKLIDFLLENKCSVNAQDTHTGKTVLHWAVQNGNVELVIKLLHLNADPNVRDKDWQTPFLLALNMDRPDILEHLLKARCNISVTDRSFNTALHIASSNGQAKIVPLLIRRGLAVDLKGSGGMTPLMLAAFGGHEQTVHTLLEYGANSSLTDRNHASALVYAILSKAKPVHVHNIVKALIRSNCDVNYAANLLKLTKTFDINLGNGIEIEERLYTPVEMSFLKGDPAVFMMLLRSGCDASKFTCDRDLTLRHFKSVHSDLKNRWILLRCINKERKRVKPLKELCRRPVLRTFRYDIESTINALPVSDKLKRFLNFSDLEEICRKYQINEDENDEHVPTNDSNSPDTKPHKPQYHTNSLTRNRLRSTIHGGYTRERTPKTPTTPILPKATWDNEVQTVERKHVRKPRTSSFSEMPKTEKSPEQRTMSTSGVSDALHSSDITQNVADHHQSKSIFDFLKKHKPKNKDSSKKVKARSKKAMDPRDTISLLLHGTSNDYHMSGEITPKLQDIETNHETPQNDYNSVNHMLYGKSSSKTSGRMQNDFQQRVNNVANNSTPNHVSKVLSHQPLQSEEILYSDHGNGPVLTSDLDDDSSVFSDSVPFLIPNATKLIKSKSQDKQTRNKSFSHVKEPSTNGPISYNSDQDHTTQKKGVRRRHSFTGTKPDSNKSASPKSQVSSHRYEDSENSLQTDIANMAKNISSAFTNMENVGSGEIIKPGNRNRKHNPSKTVPNIKVSAFEQHEEPSLMSPTSTTSKSSFDSSSSVGNYQFPTGDAQLLHKYLHSQSPDFRQNHKHLGTYERNNTPHSRPETLDIFAQVEDFNGNNIDDTMSQSSIYSNPSCDSRSERGRKVKTSSVSSLSSSDSRKSPSKIPVLQHPWSPQPVRSKIPIPASPTMSPASRTDYGRFARSKSFRKY